MSEIELPLVSPKANLSDVLDSMQSAGVSAVAAEGPGGPVVVPGSDILALLKETRAKAKDMTLAAVIAAAENSPAQPGRRPGFLNAIVSSLGEAVAAAIEAAPFSVVRVHGVSAKVAAHQDWWSKFAEAAADQGRWSKTLGTRIIVCRCVDGHALDPGDVIIAGQCPFDGTALKCS